MAIIDGDTYEVVNTVDSGYAVHITRMSATGRYAYVIGRDGKLALIDLWMEKPDKVAEVQMCYDARSVEVSKYKGDWAISSTSTRSSAATGRRTSSSWTAQTLEPFKIVSTRSYTYDTEEYHPEPRVAAILASHFKPEWIVNIKETGQVWLVNYTDPINPTIKMIEAERFLHDGGLDATQALLPGGGQQLQQGGGGGRCRRANWRRWWMTATVPHPGRGANWIDPEFGPVWSTSHLGDPGIVVHRHRPGRPPRLRPGRWCATPRCPAPAACSSRRIPTARGSGWI